TDLSTDSVDSSLLLLISFFFQAEDGIRDFHVTGVQTCALPIFYASPPGLSAADAGGDFAPEAFRLGGATAEVHDRLAEVFPTGRSEERRVGKERGSRARPSHQAKNKR